VERVADAVVDANQLSEGEASAREQARDEAVRQMMDRHELKVAKPEEIQRTMLQEWLDHQQTAWVPVAVVSELALLWPRSARATRITVNQRELKIETTTDAAAQSLTGALKGSQWLQELTVSEKTVTGRVLSVTRELAPETDDAVSAEIQRLSDGYELGSSPTVTERNIESSHASESDAFNCWRRVVGKKEGFRRLDGTWSEGGTGDVRPEKPAVSMGQWAELSETESGGAWARTRASVQLQGSFAALVQGLDCVQMTGARYSVNSIEFKAGPASAENASLQFDVDLISKSAWAEGRNAPWSEAALWGVVQRPERSRSLKGRTLMDPFAG